MSGNTIGKILRLTSFGESHGGAIGGVIDGCPSKVKIDLDFIRKELARRQCNKSFWCTGRTEPDEVEFLSGLYDGLSTGTPLAFVIKNKDARPADYSDLKELYRPSHADYTYQKKYQIRDFRGGGRASARETVVRVVGGAIAKMYIKRFRIKIQGYVSRIGEVALPEDFAGFSVSDIENSKVRCPDAAISEKMLEHLRSIKLDGDSTGGVITCVVTGVPVGLGEPIYEKLNADLARAIMSINAVKGIEFGSGFQGAAMRGSDYNDVFMSDNGKLKTLTNHDGGIQGGIANGNDIVFRVAFKPPSTIALEQDTVDANGEKIRYRAKGRHDVCIVPRAVPIVESMAALVIADHLLMYRAYR
jgi:chorismate synthase